MIERLAFVVLDLGMRQKSFLSIVRFVSRVCLQDDTTPTCTLRCRRASYMGIAQLAKSEIRIY